MNRLKGEGEMVLGVSWGEKRGREIEKKGGFGRNKKCEWFIRNVSEREERSLERKGKESRIGEKEFKKKVWRKRRRR